MKILVIDDSSAQQKIAKLYLETMHGHTVTGASTGMDGIDFAIAIRPDLIIIDTHMPDISGKDTLRVLKKIKYMRDTPVIMAGTEEDNQIKDQLLMMGAADFILKHHSMDTLNKKIHTLVQLSPRAV